MPRSWQEVSKIQCFLGEKSYNFFWFSRQNLGYSWFSCQEVQYFSCMSFHDLLKSCKIWRTLPRLIAKILVGYLKNPRFFLAGNPRFFLVFSCEDLRFFCFCCQELQDFSRISLHDLENSCKIL